MPEAACAPPIAPVAPAAIVEKTAIPIVPPISCPVELRPEIIPDSSSRVPIETEPGDEHPGEDVAGIGAVLADLGEERHTGCRDQKCRDERHAHAVPTDDVASRVGAGSGCQGERDEGETGHQRVRATFCR